MSHAESARTVGDVIQAHHPTFATVVTVSFFVGVGIALLGAIVAAMSGAKGAARACYFGLGLMFAVVVALLVMVFATVFPWIGLSAVVLAALGIAIGLRLRRRRKRDDDAARLALEDLLDSIGRARALTPEDRAWLERMGWNDPTKTTRSGPPS